MLRGWNFFVMELAVLGKLTTNRVATVIATAHGSALRSWELGSVTLWPPICPTAVNRALLTILLYIPGEGQTDLTSSQLTPPSQCLWCYPL